MGKNIRYLYLDIVNYSEQANEQQSLMINTLNKIIVDSLKHFDIKNDERTLLPVGDAICIALENSDLGNDIPLQLALEILKKIDETKAFEVRIGINENEDDVVIDINERKNFVGYGINRAQRIMDQAAPSQIMIGVGTHEKLRGREKYRNHFRTYAVEDKHNNPFDVYQYTKESQGLITTEKIIPQLDEVIKNTINQSQRVNKLEIIHAEYGSDDKRYTVTQQIKNKIRNNSASINPNDKEFGDPHGQEEKWFYVVYSYNGKIHLNYILQNHPIKIPDTRYSVEYDPPSITPQDFFPGRWKCVFSGPIEGSEVFYIQDENKYIITKLERHAFNIERFGFNEREKKISFAKIDVKGKISDRLNNLNVVELGKRYEGEERLILAGKSVVEKMIYQKISD